MPSSQQSVFNRCEALAELRLKPLLFNRNATESRMSAEKFYGARHVLRHVIVEVKTTAGNIWIKNVDFEHKNASVFVEIL